MFVRKLSAVSAIALMLVGCNATASKADDSAEVPQKKVAKAAAAEAQKAQEAQKPAGKEIAFKIAFKTHLDMNLPEQDVFIEREAGSGKVYRVTKGDNNMNAPLYKAVKEIKHDPFDPAAVGPYAKGEPLDMTLGQWLKGSGTGTYRYENGVGHLKLKFANLVPNGVYTMWHAFIVMPPTKPFSGALDAPLGERDGSSSVFTADADGNAEFEHSFRPGLQLSDTWTAALLAIAYHSDGKTYGGVPGKFGYNVHVPLFVILPKREGIE